MSDPSPDAATWGLTAHIRRMARTAGTNYPRCDGCRCQWHGLACRTPGCGCETSVTDERETA